jgi:hypothetical protein
MNTASIVSYLAAQLPGVKVGGAAEADSAMAASSPVTPACYVIEEANQVAETGIGDDLTIDVAIAIYIVTRNAMDSKGSAGIASNATLRDQIINALHGYLPPESIGPLVYQGGQLADFSPGLVWWSERFTTVRQII